MSEDFRLCPDCQNSVNYDDMIWLDGSCTCPACYLKRREAGNTRYKYQWTLDDAVEKEGESK